jgi:hypothetical protein
MKPDSDDPMDRREPPEWSAFELELRDDIKREFEELWTRVDAFGPSRETSIAKRKLEEACMWLMKHLTNKARGE